MKNNRIAPLQTVPVFAADTGMSEKTIWAQINRGQLPTVKIGKRRLVDVTKILAEKSESSVF